MRTSWSSSRLWRVTAVVLVAACIVSYATGVTPWLGPLAAVSILTVAIAQRTSWSFAIAAAIITSLATSAVILRLTPSVGWSLVTAVSLVLVLLSLPGILLLISPRPVRLPSRGQGVAALVITAFVLVAVSVVVARATPGADFEWAMHNDAVWNAVTTRFVITDGGLDSGAHPNSSPLTAMLMASSAASGRAGIGAADLFEHDIVRFVTFWLLAAGASSVLAGIIGYRTTRGAQARRRWAAAIIVGLLPSTWYVFGVATDYGFFNGTIAVLLLCAAWIVWLEGEDRPLAAVLVLGLAAVCLLATWAPLALIPLALAAVLAIRSLRGIRSLSASGRRRRILLLAVALLPAPLYALLVTLPDLGRDGAALAAGGAFIAFVPLHAITIAAVTLAVVLILAVSRRDDHTLVGSVLVVVAGTVALAYLLYQRRATDSLWGYYPAKFAWFVCVLLLVVLTAEICRAAADEQARGIRSVLGFFLAVLVPGSLMATNPPPHGWRTVLTPVAIALGMGPDASRDAARTLFELAESGVPTIALHYSDPATDQFANGWLLQLESDDSREQIRNFSYYLAPGDEAQACEAIRAWDREVRVVTSDPELEERLRSTCEAVDVVVDVRTLPAG